MKKKSIIIRKMNERSFSPFTFFSPNYPRSGCTSHVSPIQDDQKEFVMLFLLIFSKMRFEVKQFVIISVTC
ncbi:Hypothetical protein, putative [Bodo saltans]|uniref:Uncharacterized protein n=1 Tax=Bodo saltans TaxID=75058 RepID=A0A0S4IP15_BODSA|nr:Hypothetical protein, putative [Bodo saltans]|eukprot:CUE90852.1 Hypothetical protein, putative [Bodo saltans]